MAAVLVLAISGFIIAWIAARLFHMNHENCVSITYAVGMRNISAGAVIAIQFFPAEVLFPVMISTLFQQVLAAACGVCIEQFSHSKDK